MPCLKPAWGEGSRIDSLTAAWPLCSSHTARHIQHLSWWKKSEQISDLQHSRNMFIVFVQVQNTHINKANEESRGEAAKEHKIGNFMAIRSVGWWWFLSHLTKLFGTNHRTDGAQLPSSLNYCYLLNGHASLVNNTGQNLKVIFMILAYYGNATCYT